MIYKVEYSSMSAHYGPSYIEADSEWEAKCKYGAGSCTQGELAVCVSATPVSESELMRKLNSKSPYMDRD